MPWLIVGVIIGAAIGLYYWTNTVFPVEWSNKELAYRLRGIYMVRGAFVGLAVGLSIDIWRAVQRKR